MLKTLLLLNLLLLSFTFHAAGQPAASLPLPPFELQMTNGKTLRKPDLLQQPVVLIYFSPDCGHCRDFTKALLQRPDAFKNKQVVMATFTPLSTVEQFERTMFLSMFPGIRAGTEGESYKMAKYYSIRKFPFVVLYDKSGKWIKSYEGEHPFDLVIRQIATL